MVYSGSSCDAYKSFIMDLFIFMGKGGLASYKTRSVDVVVLESVDAAITFKCADYRHSIGIRELKWN